MPVVFEDLFRAWDRFATVVARTWIVRIEQTRIWRGRFMDAVR